MEDLMNMVDDYCEKCDAILLEILRMALCGRASQEELALLQNVIAAHNLSKEIITRQNEMLTVMDAKLDMLDKR